LRQNFSKMYQRYLQKKQIDTIASCAVDNHEPDILKHQYNT
jgi:hypothetical protein